MRFLTVKNWEKFQHQSDRRLPWIKFFTALLEPTRDPAYALLSDTSKATLHHIWLMARVFNNRIPEDWLTRERLNLQSRVNLDPLLESGFISFQTDSSSLACAHRASKYSLDSLSEEPEGECEGKPSAELPPAAAEFESCWSAYPRKKGRDAALRHFRAQIRTRADLAALQEAIQNYRRECAILATEERYTLHGSTFFNGRWRDYAPGVWIEPKPAGAPPRPPSRPIALAPEKAE